MIKQVLFATYQQSLQQSHPFKKRSCPLCADAHSPSNCMEFKSPEDRMKAVKLKKLCSNCLSVKHSSLKDCQSQIRCFRCHQMHHTSLHNEKGSNNQPKPSTSHTGCLLSIASSKTLANKDLLAPSDDETIPFFFLKTAIATVSSQVASSRANLLIDEGSPSLLLDMPVNSAFVLSNRCPFFSQASKDSQLHPWILAIMTTFPSCFMVLTGNGSLFELWSSTRLFSTQLSRNTFKVTLLKSELILNQTFMLIT